MKKARKEQKYSLKLDIRGAARLLRCVQLVQAIESLQPPYGVEWTLARIEMELEAWLAKVAL